MYPRPIIFRICSLLLLNAVVATNVCATDPAWWSQPATSIWSDDPVNIENDAVVNLGQLKHVTTQAKAYLDQILSPLGAGDTVNGLFPFTQDDNYAAANVGQLKNISAKFYARMYQLGFDVRPGLIAHGVNSSIFTSQTAPWMPWDISASSAENAAPINIGQFKLVFSFDLAAWTSTDANSNSVPDWLETYASTLPASQDSDGDGFTDTYELLTGSDPDHAASPGTIPGAATGLMIFQPLAQPL